MEDRTKINEASLATRHIKNFIKWFAIILAVMALSAGVCFAKTIPEFERMTALVGEWKGTSMGGKPATVTYTLVSDNSPLG